MYTLAALTDHSCETECRCLISHTPEQCRHGQTRVYRGSYVLKFGSFPSEEEHLDHPCVGTRV